MCKWILITAAIFILSCLSDSNLIVSWCLSLHLIEDGKERICTSEWNFVSVNLEPAFNKLNVTLNFIMRSRICIKL